MTNEEFDGDLKNYFFVKKQYSKGIQTPKNLKTAYGRNGFRVEQSLKRMVKRGIVTALGRGYEMTTGAFEKMKDEQREREKRTELSKKRAREEEIGEPDEERECEKHTQLSKKRAREEEIGEPEA